KLLHVGRRPLRTLRNQWSVIQGRRVGEWHRKHRSASAGRDRRRDHGPTGGARLLRRSPVTRGMDGEARLLPGGPPSVITGSQRGKPWEPRFWSGASQRSELG